MERPIIFSTEMVKAILDGRKTMTRRVIVPQLEQSPNAECDIKWGFQYYHKDHLGEIIVKCPYGQIGDRLWARKTWRVESFMDGEPLLYSFKDGSWIEEKTEYGDTPDYGNWYERICIQSTEDAEKAFKQGLVRQEEGGCYLWDIGKSPCRWRPSIFMPRWASRILLEITGVRVERLQEITIKDALAEGTKCRLKQFGRPIGEFMELWDSLNAKRGYGWDTNPWVWVIKFDNIGVRVK